MQTRRLGQTDLEIAPFILGTNTAGWTADEAASFRIFDAFVDAGFTALDTADAYSRWVPGNDSESEKIIGRWMKARGNRGKVHVFTKVGSDMGQGHVDLSAKWIEQAVEGSLTRLQTDYIDLYQSHWFDPKVSQHETLEAYDRLVKAGKVRWIGTSNFDATQLGEALEISAREGFPRYQSVQNIYNLIDRSANFINRPAYEGPLQDLMLEKGLGFIPYYSLAAGFLTGKYRSLADIEGQARGATAKSYIEAGGLKVFPVLDAVAEEVGASQGEVALAWLSAQPGVIGPLASASHPAQLESLIKGARLVLSPEQIARLNGIGQI